VRALPIFAAAFFVSHLALAADAVWSVEVSAEGKVPAAEIEKAAGALRAGLRAAGKVVAPDAKSAEKRLVAHVSENADDFALRVDAPSAAESGVAVVGPLVLLEDGAKRAAIRMATPTGRIAIPPDVRGEWQVDGGKIAPEAGTALVVERGTHVVANGRAMALVDVAGGETTPFPRAALASAPPGATVAKAAKPLDPAPRSPAPAPDRRGRSPWLWIGAGAAVLAAGGAAALASQSSGSSSAGAPVPSGTPHSSISLTTGP